MDSPQKVTDLISMKSGVPNLRIQLPKLLTSDHLEFESQAFSHAEFQYLLLVTVLRLWMLDTKIPSLQIH